jgi:hypothetical protein
MELCSKQKSVQKTKYILFFRFFKVATVMTAWHSLNQLHEVVTWIAFTTVLKGVITYGEHLLSAFPSLCGPIHLDC